jgi:hypothetical protein
VPERLLLAIRLVTNTAVAQELLYKEINFQNFVYVNQCCVFTWPIYLNHNYLSPPLLKSAQFIIVITNRFLIITGRKRKRCCLENRLGWNSSPISALCVLHHRGSQQGVQTDSWEICAGVQLDHDERKYSTTIDTA